jgi:hypothetical protein
MNTYPEVDYPDLYQEILKDYNWKWGKFSPIPYPMRNKHPQSDDKTNNVKH